MRIIKEMWENMDETATPKDTINGFLVIFLKFSLKQKLLEKISHCSHLKKTNPKRREQIYVHEDQIVPLVVI